jgi:arginyl-tRNA synthetase
MDGDITINCFKLARVLRSAPDKIAEEVRGFLKNHAEIEDAIKIKAFVNVILKPEALMRDSVADISKLLSVTEIPPDSKRKILIEYSAPNTNKPQHLGHVRNNVLGMSLASLMKRTGHEVVPVNLVNDRGIHICKSMIAYQRFGNGISPETSGVKGDHLVGDFYVKFNDEFSRQAAEFREQNPEFTEGKSDDDLFLETEIGQAARKMLQDWESGVPEVKALWRKMNSWVFEGFAETYSRMGVEFTKTYFESDTYLLGKKHIEEGLEKGIFYKREDGATLVNLGRMGEKVLLRSDGTSVYITQDIGATIRKYNEFTPDSQIWIVGDEQALHFKMLFEILKKMGYLWAENLYHLAYGMVNLPSGKMKSREGTVVDADDLFDEMVSLARSAALERCGSLVPEDLEKRAETIGMGALKFMLLKFNPKTTIMFDPQASVKFEGDTGPYIQYACARINSIERKSAEKGINFSDSEIKWELLSTEFEKKLAVISFLYPGTLKAASEKMDCSVVVNYLLDLAKSFSRFYRECPVLATECPELRNARLALCFRTRDILTDGLKTLTIDVPEAM